MIWLKIKLMVTAIDTQNIFADAPAMLGLYTWKFFFSCAKSSPTLPRLERGLYESIKNTPSQKL